MYSKTPQSADFGTEQNCTADCKIRRLRVLLYVVNGAKHSANREAVSADCEGADCGGFLYFYICFLQKMLQHPLINTFIGHEMFAWCQTFGFNSPLLTFFPAFWPFFLLFFSLDIVAICPYPSCFCRVVSLVHHQNFGY